MSDFVAVVKETKYDTASGKFLTRYLNLNTLVGEPESVQKVRPELEKFIQSFGGRFKIVFRLQQD